MHGSGQVLTVDDAKRCSSHSSILELLAGVHSNGNATGRTGTIVRGDKSTSLQSLYSAPNHLRLDCHVSRSI